ncbi:MAG: glycosyltransferase family 39 protein [Anaerolineae bacterium]
MNVAKTLVEDGVYAEKSSDGYRFNGAVISTGPTVILPIAAMYKLVGVGVVPARMVIVAYGVLTLGMVFLVARRLIPDWRFALAAVVLALLSWGNWMPLVFRTVMGEGPGAFFVLAALWLWFVPKPRLGRLMGVGLLLGLAAITKTQYGLIIFPGITIALLLEMIWYRKTGWRYFVVPGLCGAILFGAWLVAAYVLLGVGVRDQLSDVASAGVTATVSYFTIDLSSIATNLLALASGQAYAGLFLVALLAGGALSLPRTVDGQRWSILTILVLFGVLFYLIMTGVTPDHNRLAVPVYLLGSFAVVRVLYALLDRFEFSWNTFPGALRSGDLSSRALLLPLLALGFAVTLVALPLLRAGYNVLWSGSDLPYQAAAYLNHNAPSDALIETWDREMAILVPDRAFHFPPQSTQAVHNAHLANPSLPSAGDLYPVLDEVTPDFIVIGPMSRWAELYPADVLSHYELVFKAGESAGAYEVFARR